MFTPPPCVARGSSKKGGHGASASLPTLRNYTAPPLARTAEFVEPDQSDSTSPVLFAKIFLFSYPPNHPAFPTPSMGAEDSSKTRAHRIAPRDREAVFDVYERATLSAVIARESGRSSIPRRQ